MFTKNSNILERYQHKLYFIKLREIWVFNKQRLTKIGPSECCCKNYRSTRNTYGCFSPTKILFVFTYKIEHRLMDLWTHSFCYCPVRVMELFLGGTFGNIGFGMQDHLTCHSVEQIINNRLSVFVRRFSNKEQS